MRSILPLLPLLILLGACRSTVEPVVGALEIRTQGTEFVISPTEGSAAVPFTVTNEGAASAFLARCGDRLVTVVDRREDGGWVQHSGDVCPTVYPMDPVELEPGETRQEERAILEPGEYRLRIGVRVEGGEIAWTPTSNALVVR